MSENILDQQATWQDRTYREMGCRDEMDAALHELLEVGRVQAKAQAEIERIKARVRDILGPRKRAK